MTSESLNIKLMLDISGVTGGVQKVKSQLSSMANTVKQSIPKINTESKKANESLSEVGVTSNKVKKSMAGIGDEAKKSLSGVVTQSNKVTQALNAMGIASSKNRTNISTDAMSESADAVNNSLLELQDTMSNIASFNFIDLMVNLWSKNSEKMKESINSIKISFANFGGAAKTYMNDVVLYSKRTKEQMRDLKSALDEALGADDIWSADAIRQHMNDIEEFAGDTEYRLRTTKEATDKLKKSLKDLGTSLWEVTKSLGAMLGKILGVTAALGAVLAVVNAIKISQLSKEMYTASQQAGFSAQAYQEWAYVLERAGIEATELKEVMKTLTESQVDVIEGNEDMIKAYERLGMSVAEVKSMNQEELWSATIKALQNVENTTERTSIAYKLFAEDTAKLTTILNLSNEETKQLIDTYNNLGGAMSKRLIINSQVLQGSLLNLRTAWRGLMNTLAQYVIPILIVVVEWITKAIVAVNAFLKSFFNLDMTPMTENLTTGMNGASSAIGGVTDSANGAINTLEKLKRVTMGFDELNIVTNPNTSSANGGSDGGSGSTTGGMAGMGAGSSIFAQASKEAEEFKKKIEDFINRFKTQIAIVGTALGGLTVAKLIEGLGKALGLGDKFLKVMKTIKNIGTSAITIVLQYTYVNEFMDKYIDGEGFKNYIMGLITAAIGTGVLYAMWGPAGLVIGLGVTAVASIKTIIDNGGISNVEGATVALTGLASAIAAIGVAWKKLGLGKFIGDLGAFIALLKEGNSVWAALGAWFPKLAGLFSKIGGAISGAAKAVGAFVGGLSGGTIAIVIGAVVLLASEMYFVYENFDKILKVAKDFFKENIAPKIDSIKESWNKLTTAVTDAGKAIWNVIPEEVKEGLKSFANWVRDVASAFGEWLASLELFETIGGVMFGAFSARIAGIFNSVMEVIDGFVKFLSGVVQVIGGSVELIVAIFSGDLQAAGDAVKKIGAGIVDVFKGLYGMTIGPIVEWVKGVISWCTKLWDELVGHSIIPDMVNAIIKWFKSLYQNTVGYITRFVSDTITKVKTMWNNIKGWFNSSVAPKFTVSYWKGKFNAIKDGAKAAFNGVISIVERAVNGIINKINTLSWKIPDWVPVFGGDTFGFNMKTVKIPRLATGGIAVNDTFAHIGEGGFREAVLPLDRNTGWMDELAEKIASRNSTPTRVALVVDGKELGWATINNINAITKQTGGLQLAL